MKKKNGLAMAATVVLGVTLLAGCSNTVSNSGAAPVARKTSAPVHLTLGMWSSSPAEHTLVENQVKAFEKSNPNVSVSVRVINGNYLQVLQPMLASHTAPDIFYVDSSVAPQLEASGALMNISRLIKQDKVNLTDFNSNLLNAFKWKGAYYGLPKDFNTLAIESNTALLAKAGISKPPGTWQQFQQDAVKLKAKHIAPLSMPVDVARYYPLVANMGGSYFNSATNKSTFPNPKNRAGLGYFMNMVENGDIVQPNALAGAGWAGQAFAEGKVAMAAEGAWVIPFMQQTAPKLKYKISDFPSFNGQNHNMLYTVSYSMAATTKNPSEAAKLLFFMTGPLAEKMTAESGLAMPSRAAEQSFFLKNNPTYKAFVDGLKQAIPYQFGTLGQNFVDAINNATLAGILKHQTPAYVLAQATKTLGTQNQY
ncbi:MAG: extracellular solute-binding protein [Bacilli bacterium]